MHTRAKKKYVASDRARRENVPRHILSYELQMANVFVLIDVRHDQQKIDREFVDWLGERDRKSVV